MQFLDNRMRFLYPNFLIYVGVTTATILIFFKYFSFLQSYGYINILRHIFNFPLWPQS